jgi:hypothetical protein
VLRTIHGSQGTDERWPRSLGPMDGIPFLVWWKETHHSRVPLQALMNHWGSSWVMMDRLVSLA